jgi:hypothetical protein
MRTFAPYCFRKIPGFLAKLKDPNQRSFLHFVAHPFFTCQTRTADGMSPCSKAVLVFLTILDITDIGIRYKYPQTVHSVPRLLIGERNKSRRVYARRTVQKVQPESAESSRLIVTYCTAKQPRSHVRFRVDKASIFGAIQRCRGQLVAPSIATGINVPAFQQVCKVIRRRNVNALGWQKECSNPL